jgi:hypothetical protein
MATPISPQRRKERKVIIFVNHAYSAAERYRVKIFMAFLVGIISLRPLRLCGGF